ncbi:hypothetical protein RI844_05680 [Thalassotalea fonticola]|uniref:Fibronectin type-III domain-containing protein n=1 Tax=Thalassotalea fonticola TaxID=3065649 RepID=A0ABZ0GSP8_9GAMM|nr:hypothetical protein RI844_05680 [Colwelliaceae bacterium S1-1]
MINNKLPLLFTAMLLTACGGESQVEPNEELPPETVLPEDSINSDTDPVDGSNIESDTATEPTDNNDTPESIESDNNAVIDPDSAIPTSLKITSNGSNISLNWAYIAEATAYNVYYNEGENVDQTDVLFTTSNTRFTHPGLSESLHSYKVQAVYQNGETLSDLSAKLQADLVKQVKLED